jgi:hypothetical protein
LITEDQRKEIQKYRKEIARVNLCFQLLQMTFESDDALTGFDVVDYEAANGIIVAQPWIIELTPMCLSLGFWEPVGDSPCRLAG